MQELSLEYIKQLEQKLSTLQDQSHCCPIKVI